MQYLYAQTMSQETASILSSSLHNNKIPSDEAKM